MQGEAFSQLPLFIKGKSSTRNSAVIDLLPRTFINQGRLFLSQEKRQELDIIPRQIYHKLPYLSSICQKDHSSF